MSILIKCMRMPEDCLSCGLSHSAYSRCLVCNQTGSLITAKMAESGRLENCPLVELPPHGRLIDADGEVGVNVTMMPGGKCRVDLIAPTVIPADPPKEAE